MILRIGSAGDAVKDLQKKLNLYGEKLLVDGYYGMNTERAVQRFQASISIPVDGILGPITERALTEKTRYLCPPSAMPPEGPPIDFSSIETDFGSIETWSTLDRFDDRTEANIATLLLLVQQKAREFMRVCLGSGVPVKIISGNRTYADQAKLYAQGRTQSGNIVTNAKPGQSFHNFGVAFDVGVFDPDYLEESPLYDEAGAIGKSIGFTWGGDWKGRKCDKPHFQYTIGHSLQECRDLMDAGKWPPSDLRCVKAHS